MHLHWLLILLNLIFYFQIANTSLTAQQPTRVGPSTRVPGRACTPWTRTVCTTLWGSRTSELSWTSQTSNYKVSTPSKCVWYTKKSMTYLLSSCEKKTRNLQYVDFWFVSLISHDIQLTWRARASLGCIIRGENILLN